MPGPVMAQPDAFGIEIKGKGGHGASPHLCKNPIPAMAVLVNAIGNITADAVSAQETAVVNICRIQCGEKYNVVAETGYLEGTIRTYDADVRKKIIHRLEKLTKSIAEAWEMEGTYHMSSGYPATVNDKTAAHWATRVLQEKLKGEEILTEGFCGWAAGKKKRQSSITFTAVVLRLMNPYWQKVRLHSVFWHPNLQKRGLRQMKTIEMIYRVTCRHCRQAFGLIEELRRSNEKYEKIEMRFLDTERDKELLEDRKFTYVPCFYIEGEMVMEGVPTKENIEAVFVQALQDTKSRVRRVINC